MQKTVYCCDICETPTQYNQEQIKRDRMVHGIIDWVWWDNHLLCSRCAHTLTRARELDIVAPEPKPLIIGGIYTEGEFR